MISQRVVVVDATSLSSWETSSRAPGNPLSILPSASAERRSRWLVGSSMTIAGVRSRMPSASISFRSSPGLEAPPSSALDGSELSRATIDNTKPRSAGERDATRASTSSS